MTHCHMLVYQMYSFSWLHLKNQMEKFRDFEFGNQITWICFFGDCLTDSTMVNIGTSPINHHWGRICFFCFSRHPSRFTFEALFTSSQLLRRDFDVPGSSLTAFRAKMSTHILGFFHVFWADTSSNKPYQRVPIFEKVC